MTDILIQPNADDDDDLTNGVVIDDATLPLSNQDAVALGLTLGTTYKLRVLGTAQTLTVTDVPAAFVSGDWSAATGSGAQEIDVTISSLPAANGQAISDVEYELDASGTWVSSGGTTSFTITAAAGATSYDIRLRAVNSNGEGAAGDTKAATSAAAATAPAQMSAPTVTATGSDSISVDRAAAPSDGGSPITSYDLRYEVSGSGSWTTVTGITDPQSVTGLSASTLYNVQTRAVNAVGAGAWSASGSATTNAASGWVDFFDDYSTYTSGNNLQDEGPYTRLSGGSGDIKVGNASGTPVAEKTVTGDATVLYDEASATVPNDRRITATIHTKPTVAGGYSVIYLSYVDADNHIAAIWDQPGTSILRRRVGGSNLTNLVNAEVITDGAVVEISWMNTGPDANTLTLKIDGTTIRTQTGLPSVTLGPPGILMNPTTGVSRISTFEIEAI